MASPLVAQGTLNKLRGSISWSNYPSLNVTAPYLSKEGIRFSPQGESTTAMPTMTGIVTSPEPFMMCEVVIHLLKTQALANQYKQQLELNALLGDGTIRPDAAALGPFQLSNCFIKSIQPLDFSGENAVFAVSIGGYYLINSVMFN